MSDVIDRYDIVLHIGAPKTGSSALQHFLFNNREILRRKGYYYPKHGFDVNSISGGHSGIGAALINDDEDKAQQIFDDYKYHAKKQGQTLLISAESLYSFPKQIRQLCADEDRVRILSFFRDPIESLISGYNQSVKRHYYTGKLGVFCQSTIKRGNRLASGEVLYDWAEAFGSENLFVAGYSKPVEANSALEKYFLSLLGIDESQVNDFAYAAKPINRAYNPVVLEFKRCLNFILDKENRPNNQSVDFLLQRISDNKCEKFEHIAPHLDLDTQAALKECFSETTSRVCRELVLAGSSVQSAMAFNAESAVGMSELKSIANEIDAEDVCVGNYIRECLKDFAQREVAENTNADEYSVLAGIYGLN